jgi:hypothetical protein
MRKFILIGFIAVFFLLTATTPAVAEVSLKTINFNTVQPAETLAKTMRNSFSKVNQDVTQAGGSKSDGLKSGGTVYYVDGNKVTAGTGTGGWSNAFNTLSAAMAASHANIAVSSRRAWATRNTIYVRADAITEDITALAQKTDIVGVGSNDAYEKALIIGTWIIPDTTAYIGCHFYNMQFRDDGAGGALMDIDTQSGLEFHGCLFDGGATDTIALQVEECQFLVVEGCEFSDVSQTLPWSASAIKVVDDTDPVFGYKIVGNIISTAGIGIDFDETVSANCWIAGNYIRATGLTIDDEGDDVFVVNNRLITDVNTSTSTAGYDFNIQLAAGNIQMGATGLCDTIPFAKIAE